MNAIFLVVPGTHPSGTPPNVALAAGAADWAAVGTATPAMATVAMATTPSARILDCLSDTITDLLLLSVARADSLSARS